MAAVQALYQMDVAGAGLTQTVAEYENFRLGQEIDGDQYREADAGWFRQIVAGVHANQTRIDPQIAQALPTDWPLRRIDTTLRAILRAAVYELNEKPDVPARVVISEYLDVAKAFYEVEEPRLVNAVLDRVARRVRENELPQKPDAAA